MPNEDLKLYSISEAATMLNISKSMFSAIRKAMIREMSEQLGETGTLEKAKVLDSAIARISGRSLGYDQIKAMRDWRLEHPEFSFSISYPKKKSTHSSSLVPTS